LSLPPADAGLFRADKVLAARGAQKDDRPLAGLRILLVDDHAPTRRALAIALQQQGAETIDADSAASAQVALARARPTVVISDLAMPEEDGYSFIRKARAAQPAGGPARPLAALALSGHAANRSRARALDAGFDRFLAKPVDLSTLVSVVVELAGRSLRATISRARGQRLSRVRRKREL
jgi:CheY-like chemotaxis protein